MESGYNEIHLRTRVKICGITRPEDGLAAAELGADAIGLVFYPPSPRAVSIEQAQRIVASLPAFVTVTALFVDAASSLIESVLDQVSIDVLQFHGNETVAECERWNRSYIKALRMRDEADVEKHAETYASASGILLDSYTPGTPGGTGEHFDWDRVPKTLNQAIVVAGGLSAGNVADAIRQTKPWAVDVSGGVEADKGIKDKQKMMNFFKAVASVNCHDD